MRSFDFVAAGTIVVVGWCAACAEPPSVNNADLSGTAGSFAGSGGTIANGIGGTGGDFSAGQESSSGTGGAVMNGAAGTTMAGGSGSMPVSDAGVATSAPDAETASSQVCPDSAVFCENFESSMVGGTPAPPWALSIGGSNASSIAVDATRATSGSNAVLVSVPGTASGGNAYERAYLQLTEQIFPAVATEMFGRVMMWLDETPNGTVHWTFIQGEGPSDGHDRLYRYGGQQQGGSGLMANFETNSGVSTDCYDHSATTMPTEQWTCVEWRFAVATNEMELWLNGVNIEDIHITGQGEGCLGQDLQEQWLAPPAFQTLSLGWERYQSAPNDRNLWLDDIVVSTERIGCAQ